MNDTLRTCALVRERTLALVKPDGYERGLVGEVLRRFERAGLKIIGLKVMRAERDQIERHLPTSPEWIEGLGRKTLENYEQYGLPSEDLLGTRDPKVIGQLVKEWLCIHLTRGPVVAIALEGVHAVDVVRKFAGDTLPYRASPGTIRGDFSIDSPLLANSHKRACENIVHASGTREEAERELQCWFSASELIPLD